MTGADVFRRTRTIVPDDIDALGHVNNAVWVEFIVQLSDAHSTDRGFSWQRVRELGGMWIVRRHEIDYHRSALEGDEILEETWVERIKGARSIRLCRFTRPSDGSLLLESTTQWAYVDPDTQRPRRIAKEILEAYHLGPGSGS